MAKFNYEAAMKRLEEIVEQLESGELDLDASVKLYEEGMKLSKQCYDFLKKAEQKITMIEETKKGADEDV